MVNASNIDKFRNPQIRKKFAAIVRQETDKKNKYSNKKVERLVNGKKFTFDSKKEADYFDELCYKLKSKMISNLKLQPKFEIIETIKWEETTLRKISYIADFQFDIEGQTVVVDVKGFRTPEYQLKKRLFLLKYPLYKFIEV